MGYTLHLGDCIEVMRGMADCSVDAIVCDPPYGLEFMGKDWDRLAGDFNTDARIGKKGRSDGRTVPMMQLPTPRYHAGKAAQQWHERWAREAFRITKPGAHLLAFGAPRTYHRMVCAIEDAGWEVRDSIHWIGGQGFPKNLNVTKAIRQSLSADVLCACAPHSMETVQDSQDDCPDYRRSDDGLLPPGLDSGPTAAPSPSDVPGHNRVGLRGDGSASSPASTCPDADSDRPSIGCSDLRNVRQSATSRESCNTQSDMAESTSPAELTAGRRTGRYTSGMSRSASGSASSSLLHERVYQNLPHCTGCGKVVVPEGLGTALKPAHEPIVVARKPLSERTIAANVLRWGTGALNVDAARVGTTDDRPLIVSDRRNGNNTYGDGLCGSRADGTTTQGRWPPNLCLSHHPSCQQRGVKRVRGNNQQAGPTGMGTPTVVSDRVNGRRSAGYADESGTEAVPDWLCHESCPVRLLDEQAGDRRSAYPGNQEAADRYAGSPCKPGIFGGDIAGRAYSDSGGPSRFFPCFEPDPPDVPFRYQPKAPRSERVGSSHPTQKPLALMEWLCKLVTPPDGVILDPFAGSGTTGVAALRGGFSFVGIEQDPEYHAIAERRLEAARAGQLALPLGG